MSRPSLSDHHEIHPFRPNVNVTENATGSDLLIKMLEQPATAKPMRIANIVRFMFMSVALMDAKFSL